MKIDDEIHEEKSDNSNGLKEERELLRCLECEVNFTTKRYLYNHLLHHIKQPFVKLDRVQQANPPLKITLKNRSGNSFEIVSPATSPVSSEPGWNSNSLDECIKEDHRSSDESIHSFVEETYEAVEGQDEERLSGDQGEEQEEVKYQVNDEQEQADQDPFEGLDGDENNPDSAENTLGESNLKSKGITNSEEEIDDRCNVNFSPDLASVIGGAFLADIDSPISFEEGSNTGPDHQQTEELLKGPKEADTADNSADKIDGDNSGNTAGVATLTNGSHASPPYGSIPGAEPTPPPEPSPTGATEYPKIKIKTTGLFKDPEPRGCTITEITDDNPSGDPSMSNNHPTPIWTTPSLEDPLKLPDNDDSQLLNLFNNNERAKDLGFSTSSDNEFISLDTYNERNRGAMQLYNPNSAVASSSLESLTGLPMQALAQQVSRLQPAGSGQGLHQQNVLINIQQFPTQPQPPYPQQHQPMYPHYPPHPGQPPMHNYGYQPPSHVYYPPAPGYPPQPPAPHMPHPAPQHQMGQMPHPPPPMGQQPPMGGPGQQQMGGPGQPPPNTMVPSSQGQPMPPPNQMQQPPNNMQNSYRPPMPPNNRPPAAAPRGPQPGVPRMPGGPRGPQMNQRAPGARPRAPMVRPRGAGGPPARGQIRPRMSGPPNGIRPSNQTSPAKRTPEQNIAMQAKRKKLDVLTPSDKDDDDCQVICMQPKNTDGGLPQIESVQGAESVENSIMHLSDSITLSVRNPPPKPVASPVKSDAKAVANILATRGITVTASAKSKESTSPVKQAPALPTALSLNGAVSIVASKNASPSKPAASESLPTIDLTDDPVLTGSPSKNRPGLPYRCDLCPAQYPNAMGLSKHRQTYHKTTSGMCELGVPLINLKQLGIMQKLSQMGINNYIPLPSAGPEGTYALPIISTKSPGNVAAIGATQMLCLGPVRAIPRPGVANATNTVKK